MKIKLDCFVPALIAALAAGGYVLVKPSRLPSSGSPQNKVQLGRDYYVSASTIELTELDSAGSAWDTLTGSAPDMYYEIYWKGTRVFSSTTKDDSFLAKWSNAEIDLKKLALNGGTTSLDNLIQAARLNIKENESIEVRVYDSDLVESHLAGIKTFPSKDLVIGDTSYEYTEPGIKRIVLRVSDMSNPVDVAR